MTSLSKSLARLLLSTIVAGSAAATAQPVDPALYSSLQWRLVGPFRAGWAEMVEGIPEQAQHLLLRRSRRRRLEDRRRRADLDFAVRQGREARRSARSRSRRPIPNVIYVGSGQPEPRYDVAAGAASTNRPTAARTGPTSALQTRATSAAIRVNPNDPNTVLVGALGHFFGPSDERGVYRTTDGGKTWTQPLAPGDNTGVVDLAADPAEPAHVFASTWKRAQWPWLSYFTRIAGEGSAIWRSDDDGAHWRRLTGGGWPSGTLGRIGLAVDSRQRRDARLRRRRFRRPTAASIAPTTAARTGSASTRQRRSRAGT